MADHKTRLVLSDFSGGRNAVQSPLGPGFAANQVVDAVNGHWYQTCGFRKRHGSSALSMAGAGFTGVISWMGRHVPATNDGNAELWAIDTASPAVISRLVNSATWASVSYTDGPVIGAHTWDFTSATLNGKFFIAYPAAANRLHVWDAALNTIRKTGIDPGTNAPVPNDSGGGGYPATLAYWRVRWGIGTRVISEPTPAASFTPSGTGLGVTVARPTVPGEGETHWWLEGSADGTTFYVIPGSPALVATTSIITNVIPSNFSSAGILSPLTGTYSLQKPYKFIAADGNRLLGFGSFNANDVQHRIEWSAIVGSTDLYDNVQTNGAEERVDTTSQYFLDLDENDSGIPTGLIGPLWGNFYPFKFRQFWELSPTGSPAQPYRRTALSKEIGAVGPHAAAIGDDGAGNPCLYFMSHRGMYRYGQNGLAYIGTGMEDYVLGPTAHLNLSASQVVAHVLYYHDVRQLWVWVATGSSNDPNQLFVFDVRANQGLGAWTRMTGVLTGARSAVLFANSIGAVMGTPLVPYIGNSAANVDIRKADDSTVTTDSGTPFAASITTRPIEVPGYRLETSDVLVLAPVASGVTLTATSTPDFGATAGISGQADLTALSSEVAPTRVQRRFEGTALGGAQFIQLQVGDASAVASAWSFDRLIVPMEKQQAVS